MAYPVDKRRFSLPVITLIALLVIAGISLYIRIALPHDQVFVHGSAWFRGTDAWYHMRHIENLVHNFPHVNSFDPYMIHPGGGRGPSRPFFDWLVAGIIWLITLGSPSQHIIDVVGAYLPPILSTLTIIAVYFIGKELFNRWVGVFSAALVAILPGEFLNRSLLGYTDHHVAESLFTTVTMLFLILALKRARERQISFTHLLHRDWTTTARPLVYTLLAGIFLGIYLLSWIGGLLLVFIMYAYVAIQFIIDNLRHKSTDYLCIIGTLSFLIASIMLLPILGKGGLETIYRISLPIAILTPLALSGISRLMANKGVKPAFYPLTLVGLAGVGLVASYAINPSLLRSMLGYFAIFIPEGVMLTIIEARPLSLETAWLSFTTSFFISFVSLGWLIYAAIKGENADKTLFLVWSIVMLVAVLGQQRFSYYFAINAALLTGYFSWRILDFAGLKELLAGPEEVVKIAKKTKKEAKKKKKARAEIFGRKFLQPSVTWMRVIVAGVAIFLLVFFPNIGKAKAVAQHPPLITEGWYSSLTWLKDNSAEPFGNPNFYYELYETPFHYPETAYGVMAWWDYGYWIMRISHRVPNSNPSQANAARVAHFFLAQDENSAKQVTDEMVSRYVIIDHQMATEKFHAMPTWASKSQDEFYETYYRPTQDGKLQRVTLFYPPYYRSTVVRLYNFDGKGVVPQETWVISYQKKLSKEGIWYKEITSSKSFSSYEAAAEYVASQESEDYRIVSPNPLATPVPLEELNHYELVHESDAMAMILTQYLKSSNVADKRVPSVKVFEYVESGES